MRTRLHHIGMVTSHISKDVKKSNTCTFLHLVLSDTEHVEGCKLGVDSWADTLFAGKNVFVEEFIESKNVTAMGFISSL